MGDTVDDRAGVYPIFYYPSSMGTQGEEYHGHGTSRSVGGTAHPDPRHATPPIQEPKVKSRDLALNAGDCSRVIELQLKWHTLTLSGTFVNAHTQIHPHARVHSLQYDTHLLA